MGVSPELVESRINAFMELCAAQGAKITHQRLEIYRVLASTDEHPDAEVIWSRVRRRIPTVSRDTVYRNLKLLAEQRLISVVGMSHERLRFDANMESHHHFICVRCGRIRDFSSRRLDDVQYPAEIESFGEPLSLHFEVKGICAACREGAGQG